MACNSRVFKIESANAFFVRRQKSCIDLEGATPAALADTSFVVSSTEASYQVWFNFDGTGAAPTPANGETLVEVAVATGENVKTMAEAVSAAVDALTGAEGKEFYTKIENCECVCIEAFKPGEVLAATADVDTGLPIETQRVGSFSDLGCLAEDFSLETEVETTDITCHQFGSTPVDRIVTGITAEIELGLLDSSPERFKDLVGQGIGGTCTPVGGTELVGLGSGSLGKSAFDVGGELRFVPVGNEDDAYIFPLAVPNFSSISFSATESQVMTVTFSILLDQCTKEQINFFYRGKPDQDVRTAV